MRGLRAGVPRGKNSVQLHRVRFSAAGVSEVAGILPSSRLPPLIHGTTLEVSTIFSRGRCGDHRSGLSLHPPTQATLDWCHPTKMTLALLRSGLRDRDDVPLAARNSKLSSRTPRVARGLTPSSEVLLHLATCAPVHKYLQDRLPLI